MTPTSCPRHRRPPRRSAKPTPGSRPRRRPPPPKRHPEPDPDDETLDDLRAKAAASQEEAAPPAPPAPATTDGTATNGAAAPATTADAAYSFVELPAPQHKEASSDLAPRLRRGLASVLQTYVINVDATALVESPDYESIVIVDANADLSGAKTWLAKSKAAAVIGSGRRSTEKGASSS